MSPYFLFWMRSCSVFLTLWFLFRSLFLFRLDFRQASLRVSLFSAALRPPSSCLSTTAKGCFTMENSADNADIEKKKKTTRTIIKRKPECSNGKNCRFTWIGQVSIGYFLAGHRHEQENNNKNMRCAFCVSVKSFSIILFLFLGPKGENG